MYYYKPLCMYYDKLLMYYDTINYDTITYYGTINVMYILIVKGLWLPDDDVAFLS